MLARQRGALLRSHAVGTVIERQPSPVLEILAQLLGGARLRALGELEGEVRSVHIFVGAHQAQRVLELAFQAGARRGAADVDQVAVFIKAKDSRFIGYVLHVVWAKGLAHGGSWEVRPHDAGDVPDVRKFRGFRWHPSTWAGWAVAALRLCAPAAISRRRSTPARL